MKVKTLLDIYAVAQVKSGDRKTQVGAGVIIDGNLVIGVNHLEKELPEYEVVNRTSLFYDSMIHAEVDLCAKLDDLHGMTVYVTLFPCDSCAKTLIAKGVKHIVVKDDRPDAPYIIRAKQLLDEAGITYEIVG